MPQYTVKSGDLMAHIETPHEAEAMTLALIALQSNVGRGLKFGSLLMVSGGQYVGDEGETYFSTERLLRQLGRMAPEN